MARPSGQKAECHFFNKVGGCKKGNSCRFAHISRTAFGQAKQARPITTASQKDDRTRYEVAYWLREYIPRDADLEDAPPLGLQRAVFFRTAAALIEKSPEAMQTVLEKLASEGGLLRIRELAQRALDLQQQPQNLQTASFSSEFVPFFQILSHEKVIKSRIAERNYETIINFLFGTAGSRSLPVFHLASNSLASLIEAALPFTQTEPEWSLLLARFHSCLVVLSKTVDLNGSAQVTDGFEPIIELLNTSLVRLSSFDEKHILLQHSRFLISRIQDRLNLGKPLPLLSQNIKSTDGNPQPLFHLLLNGPGDLSKNGRRHDNDFEDICQIRIMPTFDELHSDNEEEYLPVLDPKRSHLTGIAALLDRQFRLTREDSVGPLRDATRQAIRNGVHEDRSQRENYHAYNNASLYNMSFDKTKGLQLVFEFPQLKHLQERLPGARRRWWELSGRLQQGGLVCLLDQNYSPIFCTVNDTGITRERSRQSDSNDSTSLKLSLYDDANSAFVTLNLVETDQRSIDLVLQTLCSNQRAIWSFIEFPGVILASFMPTLQALQRRQGNRDLPFADLIVASAESNQSRKTVDPPAYSQSRSFKFDLSCLTNGSQLFLSTHVGDTFDIGSLKAKTTLDDAQAKSLVAALTQRFALIQGPPGTGKSYTGVSIIKTLLANRKEGSLGPIIIVCYTNHALDQLLEHLLAHGVEQIIRMGSRSKLAALEKLTLGYVSREMIQTKHEKHHYWLHKKATEEHIQSLQALVKELSNVGSSASIALHLENSYNPQERAFHIEIFQRGDQDEDGFTTVRYGMQDPLGRFLSAGRHDQRPPRQLSELLQLSVSALSLMERWVLFEHWRSHATHAIMAKFKDTVALYLESRDELRKVRQETDLRCLEQAEVIGMTTTGLAQGLDLLERLGSKVLICEEAGEVLESHALATLLPSIEHAILIGDHFQLRPQIRNNDLSIENPRGRKYSLDVSLFERLVTPTEHYALKFPFSTLSTQRRMHPSVSDLIRMLYPDLLDSTTVHNYPGISGMRQRLFWFNHEHPETAQAQDRLTLAPTSHTNEFEVEMTVRLVSHLVKQAVYQPGEIAVITPYTGQLRRLRDKLSNTYEIVLGEGDDERLRADEPELNLANELELESRSIQKFGPHRATLLQSLRIATVDSFQGEEAKVVIISLVRCNEQNKCGFLKTSNRINVLLSRAKHGMYIIGNARTCRSVPMWSDVLGKLEDNGNTGNSFELCCPRHPGDSICVSTPDDFLIRAPEGGCDKRCNNRLPCGHACITKCHSEMLHETTRCLEKCPRKIDGCDEHSCPKVCGDKCPPKCHIKKPGLELPCGHIQDVPCHQSETLDKVFCQVLIQWDMDSCGHETTIMCGLRGLQDKIRCNERCDTLLSCGHVCDKICCRGNPDDRDGKTNHGKCQKPCDRPLPTCSHKCHKSCHEKGDCGLCMEPCETSCVHSQCKRKCSEPCQPCAQDTCVSACPHSQCQMPCAVPCDRLPCSQRCALLLDCGHQCPSLCGETCPDAAYCQICGSDAVRSRIVDMITLDTTFAQLDLDSDPCLFPSCGHFFAMSSLDGHFALSEYYEVDANGSPTAITSKAAPFCADGLKLCSECRQPLQQLSRYSRITKRASLDLAMRRFMMWAQAQYICLESMLQKAEHRLMNFTDPLDRILSLKGSRIQQIISIGRLPMFAGPDRRLSYQCCMDIMNFTNTVRQQEQPFQRVWMLEQNARRTKGLKVGSSANDIKFIRQSVQMRYYILACALSLRCELMFLSSVLRTATTRQSMGTTVDFSSQRAGCDQLIKTAAGSERITQQSEGHVLFAKFAALESCFQYDPEMSLGLREEGLVHLGIALDLCDKYPGQTAGQRNEIEETEKMLQGSFYTFVTNQERESILKAMAQDLRGTGHWYTCENGHPFAIGECGAPMEQASCPECGAAVGGQDHAFVEGTSRDAAMEEMLRNMTL